MDLSRNERGVVSTFTWVSPGQETHLLSVCSLAIEQEAASGERLPLPRCVARKSSGALTNMGQRMHFIKRPPPDRWSRTRTSSSLQRTSSQCKSPTYSRPEEIGSVRACPSYSEDCTYPNEAGRTPLGKGASVSYGNRDRLPCQQVSACIGIP